MDNKENAAAAAIISVKDSFLAKSLVTKLKDADIDAGFMHASMKELEKGLKNRSIIILFLDDELLETPETLVFLKDTLQTQGSGLLLIGEEEQYRSVRKILPETNITEWFRRPLDIDRLIKSVTAYLDENTGENSKKTVLIVDDDITYLRTVYGWLKDRYHVGMANNGVQAISYLSKNRADLILLDYEMPIASGKEVLAMLKSDYETDRIPVMFLTGHSDRNSVMSVLELHPEDYLLKTIGREGLLQKLDSFFRKQRMAQL